MAGPSFYHPDQAVFLREPHAIRLHPIGGGASCADGAMLIADATLTSASNPFLPAHVGCGIRVAGAGAAGVDLYTTIAAYTNPGSVELAVVSGTAVGAAACVWGLPDTAQLQAALDTGKRVVPSPGTYWLTTPVYPLSNSLLDCLPGVHFISTCNPATEFPFLLSYLLTGVTTHLEAAPVVGSRTITTHDTVPIGSLIMIRDLTGGAWRRNFYRTTNVAGGGTPYTVTLDRPLNFSFDTNDEVAFCTRIAEKIHLYFNGADITGTGVRAIYATGAQHCTYHDLHVIGTGWTHSGISWDEGDYDCHSYRCSVESDGTACAGGGGYTIESSEHCSHESPIVNNIAGVGILLPDNVDCWVSNPEIHKCSTGIWIYATDATKGSDNVRIDSGKIGGVSANGVQVRVASKNTLVRGVKVATAGGSCFLIDGACDNTTLEDCTGTGATTAGIEVSASTRTKLRTVTTDSSLYGIISDSDLDVHGWSATGCQCELSVTAGTPKIVVRKFVTSGVAIGGFHYRCSRAGVFDFADGSITVPNGDYCIRMNAAGTLKLRNVACATSNAYHIYLDGAVAGVTYDLGGNSFTGVVTTAIWLDGTSHKVWKEGETAAPTVSVGHNGSTVAQLNWGTFVSDTVPNQVTVPNAWITGATDTKKILLGLGTLGGVPCPIVESAARAAGNFYMTAHVAGNTTAYTYRLAE